MSDFYNKYPYTDFHELNLDWVIERVKKLTEDWLATHEEWVGMQQEWADTEQAWVDFKAYVENYLANLDVQDEIDNKINSMILDGSFETIIRPTVISQTTAATEAWLAAHITQPTTPAIDNTLTIAGAAADAKATGDEIHNIENALSIYQTMSGSVAATGSATWKNVNSAITLPTAGRYFVKMKGGHANGELRLLKALTLNSSDIVIKATKIYENNFDTIYMFDATAADIALITYIMFVVNTADGFSVDCWIYQSDISDNVLTPAESNIYYDQKMIDATNAAIGDIYNNFVGKTAATTTAAVGRPVFDVPANPSKITGYDSESGYYHRIYTVNEGERYLISISTETNRQYHVFQTDASGNIIRKEMQNNGEPAGTVKTITTIILPGVTSLVTLTLGGTYSCDLLEIASNASSLNNISTNRLDIDNLIHDSYSNNVIKNVANIIDKNNGRESAILSTYAVGRPTFDDNANPTKITGADGQSWATCREFNVTEGDLISLQIIPSVGTECVFMVDASYNILWKGVIDTALQLMNDPQYLIVCKDAVKIVMAMTTNGNYYVYFEKTSLMKNNSWLPAYYYENDYWPNKITEISEAANIENGVVFAFWTDPHFYGLETGSRNPQNSKYMLKDLLDHTSMQFIVCGGDIPAATGTADILKESEQVYIDYVKMLDSKVFGVRGNHDLTIQTGDPVNPRVTMSWKYAYNMLMRTPDFKYFTESDNNGYYYIDVESSKIRMIFVNNYEDQSANPSADINQTMSSTQYDWIANAINSSQYDIIVIGHVPVDPNITGHMIDDTLFNILKAAKNKTTYSTYDFSSLTLNIIAYFSGHVHENNIVTTDNLLSITTSSDSYYNVSTGEPRANHTITEQAFDVAIVDQDNKTITLKRCGAGADRSANYT